MYRYRSEKGTALVIALMVMVVMSMLAAAFIIMTSFEPESSRNEALGVRSYYGADASIESHIHELVYGEDSAPQNGYPDLYDHVMIAEQDTTYPPEVLANGDTAYVTISRSGGYVSTDRNFKDIVSPYAYETSIGDGNAWGKPVVVDLDGDDVLDVLIGTDQGEIYRFIYTLETISGEKTPRWILKAPTSNPWITLDSGGIFGDIIVTDLTEDGVLEIIVNNNEDDLYCYNVDGSKRWQVNGTGSQNYCWSPGIGDIDRESGNEIAYSTTNGVVMVDSDGSIITTIPYPAMGGYTHGRPLLVDVNGGLGGDPRAELIFTDGIYYYCFNELDNNWEEIWRYPVGVRDSSGTYLASSRSTDEFWVAQPYAFDIDRDGDDEILASPAGVHIYEPTFVVLDYRGRLVDETTKDLNFDGIIEQDVLVPNDIRCNFSNLHGASSILTYQPGIIADCNDDGFLDIFIQTNNYIHIMNFFGNSSGTNSDISITTVDTAGNYAIYGSYSFVDYNEDYTGDFPTVEPVGGIQINGEITFENIDVDPQLELIYGTNFTTTSNKSYLVVMDNKIDSNTQNLGTYERLSFSSDDYNTPNFFGGVTVEDLNGDGYMEIVAASAGGPDAQLEQFIFVYSLKTTDWPKCIITAEIKGKNDVTRKIETVVRLQLDDTLAQKNYEVLSWIEK